MPVDKLKSKDLLGLEYLATEEINLILDQAASFKQIVQRPVKTVPALRGKTVVNLFLEPSTRTRTSFELAAKRLSADVVNIAVAASSITKGETLLDTVRAYEAMNLSVLIMRHTHSGSAKMVAGALKASVVNAGDGMHEHPTQGLLDLFTMREAKGAVKGLRVSIIGDIAHSRVARSNIWGLTKLGARVCLCGPATMIPRDIEKMAEGVSQTTRLEEALDGADVVMMLRIQMERQKRFLFPSTREYSRLYSLTTDRLKLAKPDCLVMHPGPMNRGVEISSGVADGGQSAISTQVTNGVAVRMAVLYLLAGSKNSGE